MKLLTIFILSIISTSALANPESTVTLDILGTNQSQKMKNQIVLNNDNCKRNSTISLVSYSDIDDFIKNLGAKVLIICTPQGELREIIDNHELLGASGDFKVTTTDLSTDVTDHHVEGKKNIAIYITTEPKNIMFFLANGTISLEYGDIKSPCWQEIGLVCPEGKVDICSIDQRAEYHMCVKGSSASQTDQECFNELQTDTIQILIQPILRIVEKL